MVAASARTTRPAGGELRIGITRGLTDWLRAHRISLALSTYEASKLILLGLNDAGQISLFDRTIDRCMGLHVHGERLDVASRSQILRFRDAGPADGWDRRYLPRMGWFTNDIDAHDLSLDAQGVPLVVATGFNSIVRVSENSSFTPVWWPAHLPGPLQGDRCHVNGFATEEGVPSLVTMAGTGSALDGWRDTLEHGGVLVDAKTHAPLAVGLCLPHSPRMYQGEAWFLESGRGRLCRMRNGVAQTVALLDGFARGLSFVGDYAVVGLSAPRTDGALRNLPLQEIARRRGAQLQCGLAIINLNTGATEHRVILDGGLVREIYDVAVLPETRRPMLVGFLGDELHTTFHLES